MILVTAVHLVGGARHEHIAEIRWRDDASSKSGAMSTDRAVEWLRAGNRLHVAGAYGTVEVRVVEVTPPYLRTVANGQYTDNLLALPKY